MKYLVIMPAMVESVATPCLESLSPSVKNNILVIDNSPEGFVWRHDVNSEHHPENMGVARSWNVGAKEVVAKKMDYLILLSAAIVFKQGMNDFITKLEQLSPEYGMESQFSFHLIAIARKTFETVGYFDENFYPSYFEESDFLRRLHIAGISEYNGVTFPVTKVAARRQGIALTIKRGGLAVNFLALSDYFTKKWGSVFEYEQTPPPKMYDHPFNNKKYGIDYWPKNTIEQLKKKYELKDA